MSRIGTRYHLAVVNGPDAGWVCGLPEQGTVVVGRSPDAELALLDPHLSRRHLQVRARHGRVTARSLRGHTTVQVARRHRNGQLRLRRPRRLGRGWTPVPPSSTVQVGSSVIEVREHPSMAVAENSDSGRISDGIGTRLLVPLVMAAGMIPLALSSSGTSPLRMIVWIVLPIVLVISVLWPWLQQRAAKKFSTPDRPPAPPPPPPADPPLLLATVDSPSLRSSDLDLGADRRTAGGTRTAPVPDLGHGIGVVGAPEPARAMGRWLLCQLAQRLPANEPFALPQSWDWAQSLPQASARGVPSLAVCDLTGDHREPVTNAPLVLVLATSLAQVPPRCTIVIDAGADHNRRVGSAWAAEVAAGLTSARQADDPLPASVALADLAPPEDAAVLRQWQRRPRALSCPIGVSATGPVMFDLDDAGPHALIAGTTGAGKSELLTAIVLSLAMRYAPADVHIIGVDYKGGATFAALSDLPHLTGVLTDLDPADTSRALASLRAELHRRERVLAAAGARAIDDLGDANRLPRLLLIVDEFRTLADSHSDVLDGLVRLAAQGRSLGIHLILATQRPAGAITADMRANIPVRLCLRVLEPTDSLDVIGEMDAARLPAIPGRAIIRTDTTRTVQIAWPGTATEGVPAFLAAIAAAAKAADPRLLQLTAPWAPHLPESVTTTQLSVPPQTLPLLRTDLPDQQALGSWGLPLTESLLISGPTSSGRSSAARTLATEAVRLGVPTSTISSESLCPPAPALGTTAPPDDVPRIHALLTDAAPTATPRLLVIDDIDAVTRQLDAVLGFGACQDLVTSLLSGARRANLGVVITATSPASRWAKLVRHHLVLAPRDLVDALGAGVPREHVSLGLPPGRGFLLDGGSAIVGQVALAAADGPMPEPTQPPTRLLPLPDVVDLPLTDTGDQVLIGVGGTDQRPLAAPLPDGCTWLVLGSTRSGRSTTLRTLAARLARAGRTVWTDAAAVNVSAADVRHGVLIIDDADRLSPAAASTAAAVLAAGAAVIASARPEPLLGAYHEVARTLREADVVIALGNSTGTTQVVGMDLRTIFDPRPHPGRGVLVTRGRAEPVQLDRGRLGADRVQALLAAGVPAYAVEPEERLVASIERGNSSPTHTTTDTTMTIDKIAPDI